MRAVNMCLAGGLETLVMDESPMRVDARKILELAVEPSRAAGIVDVWWRTLRHLAPQWVKNGTLREFCGPFTWLLQLDSKDIHPALDMLGHR